MEVKNYKYGSVDTESTKKDEQEDDVPSVSYYQLYKFSTTSDKILLVVAIFSAIIAGVTEALFSIVFGRCVAAISNFETDLLHSKNQTEKFKIEDIFIDRISEFAISTALISMIIFVLLYVSTFIFNYTAMKQTFKIRELYFYRVINQDISWHDQFSSGNFASRIVEDLKKYQDGINDKAALAVNNIATIISCISLCLIIGWKLTLVSLITLPVFFFLMGFIGELSTKLAKDETEVYGEAGKVADETLTYIKTVVAFDGQEKELNRYNKFLAIAKKFNMKRHVFEGIMYFATYFFMYLTSAVVIWYGVRLIMKNRENGGDYNMEKIVTIFDSIYNVNSCLGALTPFLETFNIAKGAAYQVFNVISEEPLINKSYENGIELKKLAGTINFKDVEFSYPTRKRVKVLKNLNLNIKSGETVALVGSSGCGKSTIIQLIQRFYDVKHGQIYIDDIEIKDLNLTCLRNQIGMVSQEPVLFDATIAENIRLGNLRATQTEIEEAAKKSNAHLFIKSFPDGYQTMIGERGTQLSGGQKQRIAIARALIRKPSILLLDEATSALDSSSEAIIQDNLSVICKECTTIIVAHRLSTVRNADRIIVMDNGAIVEDGSHDDLMLLKGTYYKLVVTQLSGSLNEEGTDRFESETVAHKRKYFTYQNDAEVERLSEKNDLSFATVWKIIKTNLFPKWCLVIGLLSSVVIAVGLIICGILTGKIFAIMSGVDPEYVTRHVDIYNAYMIGFGLLVGLSYIVQMYFVGVAGEQLTINLRGSMFKTMIHQKMGWFDLTENGVGSLSARLVGEPSSVQNAICLCVGPFINVTVMTLLLLCVGLYVYWKLLLGIFGFFPILVFMLYVEHKVLVEESQKNMEVLEQSTKLAVEAINNVRTVASLSIEKLLHDRYTLELESCRNLMIRNIHIQGFVYGFARSSLFISYIATLYYGAHLIKNGETDATTVIAIAQIFVVCLWNTMYTLAFLPNLTRGFVACNQINELLNRMPKTEKFAAEKKLIGGDIEYKGVCLSYPTRPDVQVLDSFDLKVPKGKTVALVGSSGCGKSTILQLLERFYDYDGGQITFGEEDITRVDPSSLRFRLGFVMQEPNLFSKTIEENIAYGNTRKVVSRSEIIAAAVKANIHNFITSLPLGYDTVLGEKGTQLSGGQKQRIAIARALVRNPEVLLLDEATSALDAESEKVVQEALNNAKEERTCIVIAHRLATIIESDVIAVMNKGKVVEKGTHHELMIRKGLYWNLYNRQHQS